MAPNKVVYVRNSFCGILERMEATFLAVDLGAESGRVIASQLQSGQVNLTEVARFKNPTLSLEGSLRWDIHTLWDSILYGLQEAKKQFGSSIYSVGVDSWAVDYGLVDGNNQLLELPYHYRDVRTSGVPEQVWNRVPKEFIWDKTGIQFLPFNSLYQWYAHSDSENFRSADHLLMIPDLIHLFLTGERCAEYTNATTTQALGIHSKQWDRELLDSLGIRSEHLANVAPNDSADLTILSSFNLDSWRVVPPATHDTASAIVSVPGFDRSRSAYISSGTWSLVGIETLEPILGRTALQANITNEGGYEGTYRVLKNVMGMWLVQGLLKDSGASSYENLLQSLSPEPSFQFLIDPDHPSLLAPESMSAAIQSLTGKSMTQPQLLRCVLESLALKYSWVIETLSSMGRISIEQIHVVGGGSRNDVLNQLTADVSGRPVVAGPVEATALGNVLVQMRQAGIVKDLSEMRALSQASTKTKHFTPNDSPLHRSAKDRFAELLS